MAKLSKKFKETCETMAMLMVIKEQSELQGSEVSPAENIEISVDETSVRFNYFYKQLITRKKSVEELEAEFKSRKN